MRDHGDGSDNGRFRQLDSDYVLCSS